MPDARTIISGEPGQTWTNDTAKPMYQLVCGLTNTCGICYQYHLKIARPWPLPLHHGCRCRQVLVKVGQTAPHPFCDYEKLVLSLDVPEQAKVMGRSLFRLWKEGVIDWKDAVTPSRIRSLEQVTAIKHLTVKQLVAAGVRPDIATRAHQAVHTAEHEQVAAHRKELLQKIAGAGVAHEMVVKHLSEKIASRVTVAPGPTYTTKAGVILPGIPGGGVASPAEIRAKHAMELKATLGSKEGIARAVAALKKAPAKKPKPPKPAAASAPPASPVSTPLPPSPGRFRTEADLHAWGKAVLPNATITPDGIPLHVWGHIAGEIERLAKDYPQVAAGLRQINLPQGNDGAFVAAADWEGRYLRLNPRYWSDYTAREADRAHGVARGFFPAGTEDPTANVTHEWGHLVDGYLRYRGTADERELSFKIRKIFQTDGRFDKLKGASVSQYGATNEDEAIAEAFTAMRRQEPGLWPEAVRRLAEFMGHKP